MSKTELTSEHFHREQTAHFADKVNYRARLRPTLKEKIATAQAIARFPNRNHTPIGYNHQ